MLPQNKNKISLGALEGAYAVVLANYAIVFGKAIKDLIAQSNAFLIVNIIVILFFIINTTNIIIEWISLKKLGENPGIKVFIEDLLTLVIFFLIAQVLSELYPLDSTINIYNISLIISVSTILLFVLYLFWNIDFYHILKTSSNSVKKAIHALICNCITLFICIVLLFFAIFQILLGTYILIVLLIIDSIYNSITSIITLASNKIQLPQYYVIEPTSICNFKCSICPHSLDGELKEGYMTFDLFKKIIRQIKGNAKAIQLYWMGEPLLCPHLFDMIKYAKSHTSAKIMISTNGSLLSTENIKLLLNSGLDKLIISCDASSSQEIYVGIRNGGNINKLNENIENLLQLSKESPIKIELQFIEMFINKSELEGFKKRWENKNCKITISCLYDWAGQMPRLATLSDNLSPVRNTNRTPCCDLWNKMCVHFNGDVSLCCFDYGSKVTLGDANRTSLKRIWNGMKINEIRKSHLQGQFAMPLCSQCNAWAVESEYEEFEG